MNQKPVTRSIDRLFSILLLVSLLFSNIGGNTVSSVQAQTDGCSNGRSQVAALDGVSFQLCLPFTPDHLSVAENNDWVQSGSWIKVNPHQEFSVYAIPYGIAPAADNLPPSSQGISRTYTQATFDFYKQESVLMINDPSISIFGTTVTGTTYLLPDQNSNNANGQSLITEWIAEAGNRVWIVRSILYGDFNDTSSRQAALDVLKTIFIESQSLGNPSTSLEQRHIVSDLSPQNGNLQALSDLPTPSWWNGDCDVNNFPGSYALGGVYRGVKACGPLNTLHSVNFGAGVSQYEWQCAELPKRYLYLLYGIAPKSADGINVVNVYDNALSNLKKVTNGTPNSGLAAGDILSYDGPTSAGHTAIVSSVSIDGNGNGSYSTIEQNSSAGGARTNTISNWWLNSNSGISVYLHDSNGSNNGSLNPPSLQAPNSGETLTSRSVHFTWLSPNATNQNGYTFRLSTNSNPDTQPWLVDTGLGNNYLSYDYSFSSDGTFYWHMRTWNTSSQASSWVTRSFIINTTSSCPSVSGEVKLYDNINCGGSSATANNTGLWSVASNFNDMAESIAIPSGWSARLYQNDNENTNESACFGGTDTNLNDNTFANGGGVGNNTTWFRVYNNSNCTGDSAPNAPSLVSPNNDQYFNEGESINLSWSATGNEYYGEVWGGPGGTLTFGWQSGTSNNIGSQWAGYTYSWHVKARNGSPESGWSGTRTFTVRPGAPSNLSATTASCSQINLSWSDNSGNEEGYKVYRNGNLIATLGSGSTSYQDNGLSQSTNYSYYVIAYRGNVESNTSNTVNPTTSACQVIPNTPSNFRVSGSTQTSITLAWDDVSSETGYKIYEWDGSSFVYLASVGANATTFTDDRGICGWDEYYELGAYNGNSESVHAGWIHGNTLPCAPTLSVPGNGTSNPYNYDLTFQWDTASGATEYLVEWWGGPYTTMQPCVWVSSTSCFIGAIAPGNTYYWHVKAHNSAGEESPWSSTWTFTIQPQTFALTVNTTGTGSGTVTSTGISCPGDCSESYASGTSITLTANPTSGSTFTGWSGACTGTGSCVVSMTAAKSVTATFTIQNNLLPDLIIQSITSSPSTPQPNQAAVFSVVIKNQGQADAGEFYVDLFIDNLLPSGCSGVGQTYELVPGLAVGASKTLSLSYSGFVTTGNHTVNGIVDTNCYVTESNESNNTKSINLLVENLCVACADTTGVFRPSNGALYLKNSNTTGYADVAINYGVGGDYPVVGDWDGNGTATIGIYRNGVFYLRNANTIGYADIVFAFGSPGDQPVAGDWNGDGIDTVGVYHSSTITFYLRNSNSAGAANMSFQLGNPGDVGIAGDWNGDGLDTTGVFRPSSGALYLKNTNETGYADVAINYGLTGDKPVTGDWNNDGMDTIGIYRNGTFYLRNSNTIGYADLVFALGVPGDMPIAGNWDGLP